MWRWLSTLLRRRSRPTREALLNEALELAMDWGESWLAPVQDRLHRSHAFLDRPMLDALNAECQAAMKRGHDEAYELVRAQGTDASRDDFVATVVAVHPWIGDDNATRLFRQSMYYALKTGAPLGKS